jgi:hypothetical protein
MLILIFFTNCCKSDPCLFEIFDILLRDTLYAVCYFSLFIIFSYNQKNRGVYTWLYIKLYYEYIFSYI